MNQSQVGVRLAAGVAVLAVLGLATPVAAQFSPVSGREYREFLNPVNPVRGEAVLGVAVVAAGPEAARSTTVDVWIPTRFRGELQVEMLTADGRFRGVGAYSGETPGGRWVPLTVRPANPDTAPAPRPGDPVTLAVAVRGPGSTLFVARWGTASTAPATTVRLYVNSRRGDMFVRAGATVVRCTPLNVPQPLRFDAYCDVPVRDVPPDGGLVLIRRDQGDEQTQNTTVPLSGIR